MKTATLLFTYHRSHHTQTVLKALKNNMRYPEKLFVFQDGLKADEDEDEWQRVNRLINEVDWCDTEIIVSEYNKGLAASIIAGVTYVFREYDAVIVMEDDCVPAPAFMDFMQQCINKYQHNEKIHSVSGYAYPVSLKKNKYDVYACGRISSWGWGTWKDRWVHFEKDYELVKKMKQAEKISRNLAMWGSDLESILVGNIRGICDSWAVFWALDAIYREKICLNPYESLIQNIGLDGSGTHCGCSDEFDVAVMGRQKKIFDLPENIDITDETSEAFTPLFGSYTAVNGSKETKEKILVYGLGNFYLRNERQICNVYFVEAFIDREQQGWFAGKRIIKKKKIDQYTYDRILVMIQDEKDCQEVVKELLMRQIDSEKILIGRDLYK